MKETPEELGENEAVTVEEQSKKKFLREPPSIPFVWELRPGVPKKDWKPDNTCCYIPVPQLQPSRPPPPPPTKLIASIPFTWEEKPGTPCRSTQQKPSPPPPVKLIASIPFEWEEMPGKPFPNSQQMLPQPIPLRPVANIIASSASTLYSQLSSKKYLDDDDENDSYTRAWISQMDLESFSSDTDEDSSDSAPSLLGNRLHPTLAFPNINSLALHKNVVSETPGSPSTESDASSTSSYMTGVISLSDASSLVGASFLECLFPLLPPSNNSEFLNKLGRPEEASLPLVPEVNRDAILASNGNVAAVRRPHTLGELILMSRRMSCRRKAIQLRNRNLSMAFMKKNAFGRCLFGLNANQVERLQGKIKTHLLLKSM